MYCLMDLFRYCCDTSTQLECLHLSSTVRNTLILIKGIELGQTLGARLNPLAFFLKLQVLTRRLYEVIVYSGPGV